MIIIDENDVDAKQVPLNETSPTEVVQPPPPYSESGYPLLSGLPYAFSYGTFGRIAPGRATRKRFRKAFIAAWVVWLLGVCLISSCKALLKDSDWQRDTVRDENPIRQRPKKPVTEKPAVDVDGRISIPQCVDAIQLPSNHTILDAIIIADEEKPFKASVNFSIPISASSLFFFNSGSRNRAFGSIHFVEYEGEYEGNGNDILVDVTIAYADERALEGTQLCLLKESDGGWGFSIMTGTVGSSVPDAVSGLRFDIKVRFPRPTNDSPLLFNRLHTNFTLFHHRLGNFDSRIKFDSVDLQARYMPMYIGGLNADTIRVRSTDGLISGRFNVTESLELITTNSYITAEIHLSNTAVYNQTRVSLRTMNSPIDASLSFISNVSEIGGDYIVDAVTNNGYLVLVSQTQPLHSRVNITARTSMAPATVLMDPAFEGDFTLVSPSAASLVEPREIEDPEVLGRRRKIHSTYKGDTIKGSVWWGDEQRGTGNIEIATSVYPAILM